MKIITMFLFLAFSQLNAVTLFVNLDDGDGYFEVYPNQQKSRLEKYLEPEPQEPAFPDYLLARCYLLGIHDFKKDTSKGFELMKTLADEKHDMNACYCMGLILEDNLSPYDNEHVDAAYYYYQKAADLGHKKAQELLDKE